MTSTHSTPTRTHNPVVTNPSAWWRTPCEILPWLFVCGDLETNRPTAGREQLAAWHRLGITDIIDVRVEWNDEGFVIEYLPEMGYHWLGTDDDGRGQSDEWFDKILEAARLIWLNRDGKMLVHCHMGVNRAPSAALAIMLADGWDVVEALDRIRAARPIAGILYAHDAIDWWHRRNGSSPEAAAFDHERAAEWFETNPIDIASIIRSIRQAGG